MKKKVFSLMMTLLLAFVGVAKADEVTVYDGTETNNYVPAYVFYFDDFTRSQFVIPAADLADVNGGTITSVKFYTTDYNMPYTTVSTADVYLKEVDYTSISAFEPKASCQVVYTGTLEFVAEGTGGACVITFSTPFNYNGGNLLVGCENTTDAGWKNIYFYGQNVDGASVAGYNSSSLDGVSPTQRNFIPKTTFTYGGGGGGVAGLHVKYMDRDVEVIDELNLGVRPVGAWMEPFDFTMYTEGAAYTVNVLDFTPDDGMFSVTGEELPFQVTRNNDVALNMITNSTEAGLIERQFVAITEGDRAAHIWPVTVELYAPEIPDVWEKACVEATTFPFVEVPANAHNTVLHDDYTLPFPEIREGLDAVYKLVFTEDQMLNAEVTFGDNGKVALYREGFEGEGGPMATNYYTGAEIASGGASGTPFEAMIGDETSTTYTAYMPFYTLYNYSISEALFTAAELAEAGVTTAPMGSLSWEAIDVTTTQSQENISIWMANVADTELTATSVLASGMTLVYTGSIPTIPPMGWNEFLFNEGSFAWDGTSNVLILVQRNNGQWSGHVNWRSHNPGFAGMAYKYQDSTPYDAAAQTYDLTVSSTSRPNTLFKSAGRRNHPVLLTSTNNPGVNANSSLNRDGWMYYDNGTYATSIGASQNIFWGTMFPANMITENRLTKVALYENSYNVSPITVHIYQGGTTAPNTEIYTQTVNPVGGDAFHEITLASPVTIDPSQNLWVAFEENGDYPANACEDAGHANNRWVSFDGIEWDDVALLGVPGYEWMIRAYLENNAPVPPVPDDPTSGEVSYSAGPVIENLPVTPGTYYLVASSTTPDFEVTINAENMPCPAVEGFAFAPQPADNEDGVEPASVTLRWMIPEYATGWRLVFGSTYHPEAGHPQTVIYPEDGSFTRDMANSFTVRNLWNNTNYFWRVEFNNDGCPNGVSSPIWGFTTHLNVPQGLTVVDETVFNDETITLNWNAVVDRTYRMYNVYRDGEFIGHTTVNNIGNTTYTDGPLAYNMAGYHYTVTAVYDEGESAPSNEVIVKVSGYGDVNGHVYEQDGTTGIANATVTMVGQDEFGVNHTYNLLTNAEGYYTGHIYAGAAYDGQAAKDGYQTAYAPVQGEPIVVNYNETASPYDYILDENFDPVCSVIAQYYPDSLDPASPFVKVYWGCGLPGEEIVEDFETGDFSMFEWQLDNSYPWSITTTNPYEGAYCMKSGGAGVPSVVSNMTVTVNIPADGVMSYFGKISCEQNWDYGYFFIDGVQKAQYTGTSNWAEKSFDITAGDHTFMWQYTKDASVNSNDDCFYVDFITFYKRPEPPQPAEPGWHTYAEGDFNNAVGSNVGTSRWAYEYPVSLLGSYAGFNMTKVSLFSDNMYSAVGGNYTCTIYQGGDEPMAGTPVSTITVDVPANMNAWVDFDLTTPVNVTGNEKLWVVWTANSTLSSWPAGCCDGLVEEGTWWNPGVEGGYEWEHETYGTWTMRQYFTNREGRGFYSYSTNKGPVAVEVPEVVKGAPVMPVKGVETVTTTCANPNAAPSARVINRNTRSLSHYRVYRTNCYNDGPYTEENTALLATVWMPDTVYIDVEWADLPAGVYKWGVGAVYAGNRGEEIAGPINWSEPVSINNATREAFNYGFEGGLEGWTVLDAPGSEASWVHSNNNPGGYDYTVLAHGGTGFAMGYSFVDYDGAYNIDSYLVSPQKYSIGDGSSISFWADNANDSYPESFSICVATAANPTIADFTTVWSGAAKGSTGIKAESRHDGNRYENWRSHSVDLSAYAGQEVWIAFHDVNYDAYEAWIDDVTINAGSGTGPTPPTPPTPGTNGLQLPRESEIVWSNCLDKDMWLSENEVDINVLLNSADSPEGIEVSFTNLNEVEQELYPIDNIVLDETGFYAWDTFRKGDYELTITREGYYPITETVSIWEPTSLRYVMIEIIYGVDNLYVSRTGWAMWEGHGDPVNPTPGPTPGGETTFTEGFEGGLNGWTVIDAAGSEATWLHSNNNPGGYDYTVLAHGGTGFALGYSFVDYDGAYNIDSYLVTPQKYTITANSHLTFWADNANDSYPESFSVCVATVDNPTPADFTQVWSGNAKANAGQKANVRHDENRYENWRSHNVDLSAYAGQEVWIAFHDVNYDAYEIWIDDVELTAGAKNGGERHLEYYKVMCESIDHEPIFNINTPHNFCQVATDQLVEGELYICKVAAVYSTGMSEYAECIWEYESCENYAGTLNGLEVNGTTVTWDYPTVGPVPPVPPTPGDVATVVLSTPTDIWGDGSGYQMFLDADHTVAADLPTGNFGGSIPAATLAEFEYSIPENADGNVNGQNVISAPGTNMGFVEVPAGIYDILVVNPDGSNVWVVGTGGQYTGITDDFTFEAGKTYTFTVVGSTSGDGLDLVVTDTRGNVVAMSNNGRIVRVTDGRMGNRDGQWYYYDNGNNSDAIGLSYGTVNFSWGIMFPAGSYNSGSLTKVGYYDYTAHTGNIHIYQGGTGNSAPGTEVYTQPYSVNGTETYIDINLNNAVAVDATQDLWVVMESTTPGYTAAIDDSGSTNPNGALVSTDGVSYSPIDVASGGGIVGNWNLRAYIEDGAPVPGPTPSGDVLGAMVFLNGEWEAFVPAPTNSYEFPSAGEYCVRIVYNGAAELPSNNFFYAMSCEECEGDVPPTCEPGDPIHAEVLGATDQVRIWWGVEPAAPINEWLYYDDGTYATSVGTNDATATIYWATMFPAAELANYAGTNLTKVAAFEFASSNTTPKTVTIYLGGTTAPGTAYSTKTYTPSVDGDFEEITLDTPVAIDGTQNLWIVCSQMGTHPAQACADAGYPNNRWISLDGQAWQDLASAGLPGYGWLLRGFVTNQGKGMVENVAIELPAPVASTGTLSHTEVVSIPAPMAFLNRADIIKYNVYRSTEANGNYVQIGEVAEAGQTLYEYFDTPDVAGMYYYQVTAVYDDGCESAPALAADDPTHNYVSASVDAIGENSDNVALYPNPTKGNVTIEANGMSRITVVSVLGQVVYDTELNADVYTLNMSQFNAGMYMVRIHTENGVIVKRVTVMQ